MFEILEHLPYIIEGDFIRVKRMYTVTVMFYHRKKTTEKLKSFTVLYLISTLST